MSTVPPPNVDDLQAAGAVGYAAWLWAHGYDQDAIDAAIERRYPTAPYQSRYAVRERGRRAWAAGDDLGIYGEVPGGASAIPGPRGDPFNYRYYGLLHLVDVIGNPAGEFPFDLTGLPLLSEADLYTHVVALWSDYAARLAAGGRGNYDLAPDLIPGDMEVLSIERR